MGEEAPVHEEPVHSLGKVMQWLHDQMEPMADTRQSIQLQKRLGEEAAERAGMQPLPEREYKQYNTRSSTRGVPESEEHDSSLSEDDSEAEAEGKAEAEAEAGKSLTLPYRTHSLRCVS